AAPTTSSVCKPKKASSRYGRFIHISDIHIDETYQPGTDPVTQCHRPNVDDPSKNTAGTYGLLGSVCDSPHNFLDEVFAYLENDQRKVDFILYSGDSGRHDRDAGHARTYEELLIDHQQVTDYFKGMNNFNDIVVIPTWGNNDVAGKDQQSMNDTLTTTLTDIWRPYGLCLDETPTWLEGGYFSLDIVNGIKVVNLNTMSLFDANKLAQECTISGSFGNKMLSWFEAELQEARREKKLVYVMGHIPPIDRGAKKLYKAGCYEQFVNLVGHYADVIEGQFFGHHNQDQISVIYTQPGVAGFQFESFRPPLEKPQLPADATVVEVMLNTPSILQAGNPGIRVYEYENSWFAWLFGRKIGKLLDYTQYMTDLTQNNIDGFLDFKVEYRASKTYGL
ncbi:Metallo-dependent phosphatase-like protein, partial [Gaertneriomyces semiglobifer]